MNWTRGFRRRGQEAATSRRVPPNLPRGVSRLLASAARWVPGQRRGSWRREWEAELSHAWRGELASGDGHPSRRLLARAAWAHLDALWVWKEDMTMTRIAAGAKVALRSLRRSPLFSCTAILTLALGIGANTAIFSVVNAVLLKPLPFEEPDRLVMILMEAPGINLPQVPFSDGIYLYFENAQQSFESVGIWSEEIVNVVGDGDPLREVGARITPSLLDVLRVPPLIGRAFTGQDATPGAEPVAVISEELWRTRYGEDPDILGRLVDLDGVMRRIVGVMPAGFAFPDRDTRIWRPFVIDESRLSAGSLSYPAVGRLAAGVDLDAAALEMQSLLDRLGERFPDDFPQAVLDQARVGPLLSPLHEAIVGDVRRPLWVVLGTVGLVLLIACANVANLFLVRAEVRQREVTLRAALGAGRGDLARYYLTESLLLALTGGAVGMLLALVATRAFVAIAPADIPRLDEIGVDGDVLMFTLITSLIAGLAFGCIPLLRHGLDDIAAGLRDGGRGSTSGLSRISARQALVVSQVALALVLLIGSGLMLRSFWALRAVDPGFRTQDVLTLQIALPAADYTERLTAATFWRTMRDRVGRLPGVQVVGAINQLPLSGSSSQGGLTIEDHPVADDVIPPLVHKKAVAPGYFDVMSIPVISGRGPAPNDGARELRAVLVSESFALRWWPDGAALGKRIREGESDEWYEIAGVVGDVRLDSLEEPPPEVVYFPLEHGLAAEPEVPLTMHLVIRTTANRSSIVQLVSEEVWAINGRLPIADSRPMQQFLDRSLARMSFTMTMLGIAASVALMLGTVGIYGVISYVVSSRTQEIGVRIALGAPARSVQRMIVTRGLALAAIGILIGLGGAFLASSALGSLLYDVSPSDPLTYTSVAAALALVAAFASWLPAMRASSVDPVVALRAD